MTLTIQQAQKLHPRVKVTKKGLETKPWLRFPKCPVQSCYHYYADMTAHLEKRAKDRDKNGQLHKAALAKIGSSRRTKKAA